MIGNPFNGQEGPFCMGAIRMFPFSPCKRTILTRTASYADFVIVSLLHFFKVIDQDIYDRIVTIDKRFNRLYKASEKWLERDDHWEAAIYDGSKVLEVIVDLQATNWIGMLLSFERWPFITCLSS